MAFEKFFGQERKKLSKHVPVDHSLPVATREKRAMSDEQLKMYDYIKLLDSQYGKDAITLWLEEIIKERKSN